MSDDITALPHGSLPLVHSSVVLLTSGLCGFG